jgi:hypothetical protein
VAKSLPDVVSHGPGHCSSERYHIRARNERCVSTAALNAGTAGRLAVRCVMRGRTASCGMGMLHVACGMRHAACGVAEDFWAGRAGRLREMGGLGRLGIHPFRAMPALTGGS